MKTKYIKIRRRGEEKIWTFDLSKINESMRIDTWTVFEAQLKMIWHAYMTTPWDFELVDMWDEEDVEIRSFKESARDKIKVLALSAACNTDVEVIHRTMKELLAREDKLDEAREIINRIILDLESWDEKASRMPLSIQRSVYAPRDDYKKLKELLDE